MRSYLRGCVVRKMLTILALGCLLFFIGGYHLLYQCRLAEVKAAVKENLAAIPASALTQLLLSPSEAAALKWEDEAEFCYHGKMYDVVKAEKKDGRLVYWCLADDKETALTEAYAKTQHSSSGKDTSGSLIKLLNVPFLSVTYSWAIAFPQRLPSSFLNYSSRFSSSGVTVLTPPPKAC